MEAYRTKEVGFRFRGIDFRLSLSHGLFSSADIDAGTRFLLKTLSALWDADASAGRPLPSSVLDAGCGVGIIGIAAASALSACRRPDDPRPLRVRCQDRDELARAFTAANAHAAGLGAEVLEAYAEPLLSGPPGAAWDLIASNVPAKAGAAVLRDFVLRSSRLLSPGGRCACVVVNPLAADFAGWIEEAGAPLHSVESGSEHRVFVYGAPEARTGPLAAGRPEEEAPYAGPGPAYLRGKGDFTLEGIPYSITAYHGVADFDTPGAAAALAAKLTVRLGKNLASPGEGAVVLVHEGDQGHYPAWLCAYLRRPRIVLSGRNVLALAASRANLPEAAAAACLSVPAADPLIAREALLQAADGKPYDLAVVFPDLVPRTDRIDAHWDALRELLGPGGTAIVGLSSTDADRFDRRKPAGFSRLGDLKRGGFRALAYRRST